MANATRENIISLAKKAGLEAHSEKLSKLLRPSIAITTQPADESKLATGASKFGGLPDLPPGFAWPSYHGRPLSFIAQIRMKDTAPHDTEKLLPPTGLLSFFYDEKQWEEGEPYEAGRWHVHYHQGEESVLKRADAPAGLEHTYKAASLAFALEMMLPPYESYHTAVEMGWSDQTMAQHKPEIEAFWKLGEQVTKLASETLSVRNRMLGYPDQVQGDVMLEAETAARGLQPGGCHYEDCGEAVRNWLLLLQVDSDPNAGMRWNDRGRLYYCIPQDALRDRHFERVICVMQSN
jgi:uncharacterized protein YwqG